MTDFATSQREKAILSRALPSQGVRGGSAQLKKFDTGWQLQEIALQE
jgi:hypothetical protein